MGAPVPTTRALWLAAVGLIPAALAMLLPSSAWVLGSFDLALLGLIALDYALAPRPGVLQLEREVEPIFSAGRRNRVRLALRVTGAGRVLRGELRDWVTPGPEVEGHRRAFEVSTGTTLEWFVTPATRGQLTFGPVAVRLRGPLGLCARQARFALPASVTVFPDLSVLGRDALELARLSDDPSRAIRKRMDGREFESLREYRTGDDPRLFDWKATARRARPIVRQYQPEQNQQVLLLLDCGRHMAGLSEGRPKLDHAVDAALRLAQVALDRRDLVGVMAFGATVRQWLPPARGPSQLAAIARTLSKVDASLEDSRYGVALDTAFQRGARRSLVVLFTDLLDRDAAAELLLRTRRLVPRHVVLVVSLRDGALHEVATGVPRDETASLERFVARRLEGDADAAARRLREGGARVVRGTAEDFAAGGVRAYLEVKQLGLL